MLRWLIPLILLVNSSTVNASSIVVLGDSISAGYGIDAKLGWVKILQEKINAEQLNYTINNESISGDTSAGGLARIDTILTHYRPQILVLQLGANDGLRGLSPKAMKQNLTEIIKRARATGAKVLLLSMRIPTNYGKRYTDMFYNTYQKLGDEHQIPVVPFILKDVALNQDLMQNDRLHPNDKGQIFIADHIWPYLSPLLQP